MIAFSHVSVRYRGSRLRALDDVSIAARFDACHNAVARPLGSTTTVGVDASSPTPVDEMTVPAIANEPLGGRTLSLIHI